MKQQLMSDHEKEIMKITIEAQFFAAYIVDSQGKILIANQAAIELFKKIESHIDEFEGFSVDSDNNFLLNIEKLKIIFEKGFTGWRVVNSHLKYRIDAKKIELDQKTCALIQIVPLDELSYNQPERKIDEVTSNFLANISHEIRTPLNGIIGFSELMVKKNINPDKQKEYSNIIYNNGTYLLKLVSDLLDLSRIESGKVKLYKTQFSINRLLYDLQLFFFLDMKNRGKENVAFRIITGLPDGSDLITADEMRMKQVIINLSSNAIKFTSKGEITVKYALIASDMLEFTVSDTGRGIDDNELQLIFDRFSQANDSIAKEYGGTGLGLAISKEFIEMHGGSIRVESQLNVGTSFIFRIPFN